MSATPVRTDRAPPLLGQHTNEVLGDLLGYDDARIDTLKKQGTI
jgi:crotonobetainyl-CoA:carnitine CoA-transferase CaiB-like acyl-CoA transferase